MSPTGYTLRMPPINRSFLMQEIIKIIDPLMKKYEYPYFIKEIFREKDQKSRDYNNIKIKLLKLSKTHKKLTYSDCFELFYMALEFYDYISAKSQSEIAKEFIRWKGFVKNLAILIHQDSVQYKNRFPSSKDANNKLIKIANGIIECTITIKHIKNIYSFTFQ